MAKEENEKEKNKPKPCPKWLNNTAKKEWRRVAKILAEEGKDFTDKDLKALEAYCINYAKWQRCEQIIDEKGYSSPYIFMERKAYRSIYLHNSDSRGRVRRCCNMVFESGTA